MLAEEQKRVAVERERERKEDRRRYEEERERLAQEREKAESLRLREAESLEALRAEKAEKFAQREKERQEVFSREQYNQNVKLLELQAEMNRVMSVSQREHQVSERKRHDALLSIPQFKEGESLVEFFEVVERRLQVGEIDEDGWPAIVASKLGGRMGAIWQTASVKGGKYWKVKESMLRVCGFTPKLAGENFFGLSIDDCKGLTAEQLYHKGRQLWVRLIAPGVVTPEIEFSVLQAWVYHMIPKKAKVALDNRVINDPNDLVEALQNHLLLEGDRKVGQASTFRGSMVAEGERGVRLCFKCNKPGHMAFDCPQNKGSGAPTKTYTREGGSSKVVCYHCHEEGHKSPQCPKKLEPKNEKEAKPTFVRRVWAGHDEDVVLPGKMNDQETTFLLDSGARISIVPENLISQKQLTGEKVLVKAFKSADPLLLPTASVSFSLGGMEWEEEVAVIPEGEGKGAEVLYGLNLRSQRGLRLVLFANQNEVKESERVLDVNRVTTRAQNKAEEEEAEAVEAIVEMEKPIVKDLCVEEVSAEEIVPELESMGSATPVIEAAELARVLDKMSECSLNPSYQLKEGCDQVEVDIPLVTTDKSSKEAIVQEVMRDPSLEDWRRRATNGVDGFLWEDGLVFQATTSPVGEQVQLMALPLSARKNVLHLAHEGLGHMCAKRVQSLIKQRFTWPGLRKDIQQHCVSCEICQRSRKSPARRAPMVERAVLTEPFESLAFDLVGPIPTGKGGARFLLTAICMASRWPEAIPLKTVTAADVAEGMVEIFSRTGIPLQLLTDQGPQFVGSLVTRLCKDLRIDQLKTTPYHPECNGMIERMHGTLGAMLTKANSQGLDWVGQVPFALFALRLAPNRDSGFSPFQLVYGRQVRSPLDVLHQGWVEEEFQEFNTDRWADWLGARMEVWRDVLRERQKKAIEQRKVYHDVKTVERKLEEGDQVLCRIPGRAPKLTDSWDGPLRWYRK